MAIRLLTAIVLCTGMLAVPSAARAQASVPLSQLLVNLIQSDIRLAPPPEGFPPHDTHFLPGADQTLAPYRFNQQLLTQIGTFPIGSPSGGFSYVFDPSIGTFQRTSESFGPAFADRALTVGRQRLSVGMNFQYSRYTNFEGADLRDGDVRFYLRHAPTGGAFFEGDLVETSLDLDVSSSTTTFFANYGLTSDWDVAVAMPIQHVSVDAVVNAEVVRLATGPGSPIHAFPGGGTTATFSRAGSATGLGDLLVRTKYRFLATPGGGLAAGLDLRLPTGDDDNLLGTGATQVTGTLIGSSTMGRLSPHFNVGYTGSSSGDLVTIPNEFSYRFGTEYLVNAAVTLSTDLIGRSLRDTDLLQFGDTTWSYRDSGGVQQSTTIHELLASRGTLNLVSFAGGGKFNVARNLLLNANLLVALTSSGLTARVTPVVGFDYSF